MTDFKKFYENYHKDRLLPKRVVGKKDFTYRHILNVLNKFCMSKDVLDVGSGVGTVDFYLASQGKNVTGIEISEKAVNVANKSLNLFSLSGKVNFILGDFLDIKIKKTFNFIICSEVLEHLENDKAAVDRIFRLTKKNGLVMITVPSKNAPLIKFGVIKKFDEESGHLRRYTLNTLKDLLRENKFKIVYVEKTEGILRNSLFVFKFAFPIIRIANKFYLVSDIITFFDKIFLNIFGESQIIVIAKK